MEYTMVVELYERNELVTWILTRDETLSLASAYPFDTVGEALSCIAGGTLNTMSSCREVFLANLEDPRHRFDDSDVKDYGEDKSLTSLDWLSLPSSK